MVADSGPGKTKDGRSELLGIQFVRGLAALLVLLDHGEGLIALDKYYGKHIAGGFFENGSIGVDLFFALSGFILVYVAYPRTSAAAQTFSMSSFLQRRFVRVVPFMWVCITAHLLLRVVQRGESDWTEYLRSMLLWPIGSVRPRQVWTLRHEVLFYLLFAFSLKSRLGKAILLAYFLSPIIWWWPLDEIKETNYPWFDFLFSSYNLLFGAGYLLGIAYIKRWIVIPPKPIGFSLIAGIVALSIPFVYGIEDFRNSWLGIVIVATISVSVLTIALAVPQGRSQPLQNLGKSLGEASYSIYLTHDIFMSGLLGYFAKSFPAANLWGIDAIIVGTALLAGIAIHFIVELPFIAIVKRSFVERSFVKRSYVKPLHNPIG